MRAILQEDFAFWLLCSIGLAINPAAHVVGLVLLLVSFWAIYERGYVDNDLIAFRNEADPKLTASFGRVPVATPPIKPWIWALLAGVAAVAILSFDEMDFVIRFACWIAVLVATFTCFVSYNRLDKKTRVWLYPVLQFGRAAAFTVIVPIEPAGVAALGALVASRWLAYLVYRLSSSANWPNTRTELVRLILFILLSILIACTLGPANLLTWGALALLLWSMFRARRDIHAVLSSAHRSTDLEHDHIARGARRDRFCAHWLGRLEPPYMCRPGRHMWR